MLAVTRPVAPSGDRWGWELKWDGVRAMATVHDGIVELFNRRVLPVTHRYPELLQGDALRGQSLLLDGEIVATEHDTGRPNFHLLQARMHLEDRQEIADLASQAAVSFMVFDVLHLDGRTLVDEPYTARRAALANVASHGLPPGWHVPAHAVGASTATWDIAVQYGLEGVVAKRLDSRYEPGRRTGAWVKVKRISRCELVVGGWQEGAGRREGRVGSLALGYYPTDNSALLGLKFAGKVGSGFSERDLDALGAALARIRTDTSPFAAPVEHDIHFVQPVIVVEVSFTEWTDLATLRHPVFVGVRTDKEPRDVHRDDGP